MSRRFSWAAPTPASRSRVRGLTVSETPAASPASTRSGSEPICDCRCGEHAGCGRYAKSSVEDEPAMWRDRRGKRKPAGQERVVREDRERADEDRVAFLAQAHGVL